MPVASGSLAYLGAVRFQGYWDAETNAATGSGYSGQVLDGTVDALYTVGASVLGGHHINTDLTASLGHYWQVTGSGTTNVDGETDWDLNDWIVYSGSVGSSGGTWIKLAYEDSLASIIVGDISSENVFHLTGSADKHVLFINGTSDADVAMSGSDNFVFDKPAQATLADILIIPSSAAANDRYTVNVPSSIGGAGTDITVKIVAGDPGSVPSGEIHVGLSSEITTRNRMVGAINGLDSETVVEYGAGSGDVTNGIAGITATNGTSDSKITITATAGSPHGNSITFTDVEGTMVEDGASSSPATLAGGHDGKVGIGTDSPISALEVESGLTTVGAVLTLGTKEPTVVANDVLGRINFYAPLETGADAISVAASIAAVAEDTFAATVNSTSLRFQTGKSEVATTKMVIDEDGNVGIGTTTPDYTLDVAGSVGVDDYIYHNGDADTYLSFSNNMLNIAAGAGPLVTILSGAVWFNGATGDHDFYVYADSGAPIGGEGTGKALFISGSDGVIRSDYGMVVQKDLALTGTLGVSGDTTVKGNLYVADDKKLYFGDGNDASFEYDEDGTDTLFYDGASLRISDDTKLEFGIGGDASIEYDEDGTNELRFAGAAVTFEQDVTFDNDVTLGIAATDVTTVTGPLTASEGMLIPGLRRQLRFGSADATQYTFDLDTATTRALLLSSSASDMSMRFPNDRKLQFGDHAGTAGVSHIEYNTAGDDFLDISGSAYGIALSGSKISLTADSMDIPEYLYAKDDSNYYIRLNDASANAFVVNVSDGNILRYNHGTLILSGASELTGKIWINSDARVLDDFKLSFGTGGDASIEYDEDGTDELRFAGAAVTFEQDVTFDNDVTLGVTATDVTTVTGRLTASQGAYFADNVGIGTASPAKALHIGDASDTSGNGTIRLQGYSAGGSANYHEIVSSGDNLEFLRNTTSCLFLKYDGNVGLGTSSPDCKLHVAGAAAFSGPSETFVTFTDEDATPSVATGNLFKTNTTGVTITTFDDGVAGQTITVISAGPIVYDVTGTTLKGGSTNITTASGDVTVWTFDGTNWYLQQFMDVSDDMSSASGGSGTITALNNQAESRLVTIGSTTTELDGEANLTFDGTDLSLAGKVFITSESTTPSQPADGKGYLYTKSDGKIYWRSYDISETDLTATGTATAADDITAGDAAVTISTTSGDITIDATANNTDIIFKGTDATADITMLTLNGSDAGQATFNSNILPTSNGTQDLGSADYRWRNIYTGDLHLKNERGDWTIVEEEDHLIIVNNKKGKKYKFVLEEID